MMENWNKGKELFDKQEFEKAIACFTSQLQVEPTHSESLYYRGLSYRRVSNYNQALVDFETLSALFPQDATIISERGVTKFHLKELRGALNDLDLAQELEPENAYRYSSRAYIRGAVKDTQGAIEDYQKALELYPNDPITLNNLGLLEEQLGRTEVAKRMFDEADSLSGIKTNDQRVAEFEKRNPVIEKKNEPVLEKDKPKLIKMFLETIKGIFLQSKERKAFFDFVKKGGKK